MAEEAKEELIGGKPEEGIEELKKKIGLSWFFLIVSVILSIITFIAAPIHISMLFFIIIYLPVIIYVLIYKWLKKWVPASVFTFSIWLNIVIIIIPIFAGLAALDLSDFSKEFEKNPKIIALLEDEEIVFAFQIDEISLSGLTGDGVQVLADEDVTILDREIRKNKVKDMVVFVVKEELFNSVSQINVPDTEITLTKEQVLELIKSDDPSNHISEELNLNQAQFRKYGKNIGAFAMILLLEEVLEKDGPEVFVRELKNENILIYPKRFSVQLLIKIIPENIISQMGLIPELPSGQTEVAKVFGKNN